MLSIFAPKVEFVKNVSHSMYHSQWCIFCFKMYAIMYDEHLIQALLTLYKLRPMHRSCKDIFKPS